MIGLIQRVTGASVRVGGGTIASIGRGLLVLVGVERGDTVAQAERLAERLLTYRVFPDDAGRMNRSVKDIGGELLLVPQFTLAADTSGGTRPGFSTAAPPEDATRLFDALHRAVASSGLACAVGRFGADMQVQLTNDGPVTFLLRAAPKGSA